MKIIGLLVVLNATCLGAWWVLSGNPYKGWAVTFTLIAIFLGCFLLVQDRATEITVKGVGTIKAAAETVQQDAQAIDELRRRVEAQSATVDLVASRAAQVQDLVDQLRQVVEFSTAVIAAQNDDRKAFERLSQFIDQGGELSRLAAHAQIVIRTNAGGPIEPGYLNLPTGHELETADATRIREIYSSLPSVYRASAVNTVWQRQDIPLRTRMEFLLSVLKSDPSLTATLYAGKFFAKQAGIEWHPFQVEPLLRWWDANQAALE